MRIAVILALAIPAVAAPLIAWKPGTIEIRSYKTAESGVAGTSTYTLRGVLREGRKTLEVEVVTRRTLVLGGQEGKLETHSLTWLDPETFDFLAGRLRTTLNSAEASYLRSERVAGGKVEIRQKLRGSPEDVRTVDVESPVVEENAVLFYLTRAPLRPGISERFKKFSAAQGRVTDAFMTLEVEGEEGADRRIRVITDVAPSVYYLRAGSPPVVVRTEVAGTEQLKIVE
jgi:hypothetical protein